jgi:hypothetical protein
MTSTREQRYFVGKIDSLDYRPSPDAEFEIQILNGNGEGEISAYVGRDSNEIIALIHASKGPLPPYAHSIPLPVIEAARQRRAGFGEYVNAKGEIIRPSFLPPTAE